MSGKEIAVLMEESGVKGRERDVIGRDKGVNGRQRGLNGRKRDVHDIELGMSEEENAVPVKRAGQGRSERGCSVCAWRVR